MDITLTILHPDVDAVSAAWEDRNPRARDEDGAYTETEAEHVARAYADFHADELLSAKISAADLVLAAATTDGARQAAWLVGDKLRRGQ